MNTDITSGTVENDIPSINRQGIVPIQRIARDNILLCKGSNSDRRPLCTIVLKVMGNDLKCCRKSWVALFMRTFTSGAGWAYDYGTSEQSKEMFEYIKAYSPVHNVRQGTSYPATLITTGDHDDRVVPAHSFKFAAELQAKQAGDAPLLIRIETKAGHGAGTPVSK